MTYKRHKPQAYGKVWQHLDEMDVQFGKVRKGDVVIEH